MRASPGGRRGIPVRRRAGRWETERRDGREGPSRPRHPLGEHDAPDPRPPPALAHHRPGPLGRRLAHPAGARRGGAASAGARVDADGADGAEGSAVEGGILREALVAQGLSPADAEIVLARLTPGERAELAQRAGELGVGGNPSLFLIVGVVLLLAILLYLPMAGRMQGWWR